MRVSSFLFSILFCLTMSISARAQQLAPERTFEEILGALSRADVRPLMNGNSDRQGKSALAIKLGETLSAKERGKKWTFKFTRIKGGNLYDTNDAQTEFYASSADDVRVNGIKYHVTMRVRINPAMMDKVKQCAVGRKIFVSGTVDSAQILVTDPLILNMYVTADDLGRAQ